MSKTYITYGFEVKDTNLIVTNLNTGPTQKPEMALWGSPTDATFGWKDWCECEQWIPSKNLSFEDYFKTFFTWTLAKDAKVYNVANMEDIQWLAYKDIIHYDHERFHTLIIDYRRLYEEGYDAMELINPCLGHYFLNDLEMLFNGWDCESIVVLDPSKVILLESQ